MVDQSVFEYLLVLGKDDTRLSALRLAPKEVVLADARDHGYSFDEAGYDTTLWQTEIALAERIGEPFDFACSMWETMWGKTYLEYLALTVAPVALAAFPTAGLRSPQKKS